MEKKPFRLGITVGRFQTFHNGHRMIVENACSVCERVGIFVGSSQESGTAKNPFSYELRRRILTKVFGDAVEVFPLPDIGVGNNGKWGEYVLTEAEKRFGRVPDLLFSGREERRQSWLDNEKGSAVAELYLPKTVTISATRMREFLLQDEKELWQQYSPEEIWEDYEELRDAVLLCRDVLYTDSI